MPRHAALPLFGFLLGVALIVSRRPDVIIHPGFWAEDGTIYFGDVYNLGVVHTILRPQAGYFETVPVLAAWVARLSGVRDAPFTMASIAIVVQALPVGLILSRRAQTISPSIWWRMVIALAYLALPYQLELDATAVNAQWSLGVAGLIVLLYAPPHRRAWRLLDAAVLIAAVSTGPFAIIFLVIAWLRRWRRGADHMPSPLLAIVTVGGLLQLASTLVIAHHVGGPTIEARPHPELDATPALFAQLVGGRVLLGAFIGENHGLSAPVAVHWAAIAVAVVIVLSLARRASQELWMFMLLGGFVLIGTLADPSVPTPAWPLLAVVPANAQRYFYIPQLVVLVAFVWIAAAPLPIAVRGAAAGLVALALVFAITGHWGYPHLAGTGYAAHVTAFDHARAGRTVIFPINPPPWSMTLVRQ